MDKHSVLYLMALMAALLSLGACTEDDGEDDEYANWKETNDQYFSQLYQQTRQRISQGDSSWKLLKTWSKDPNTTGEAEDYVVVHVLSEGTGTECPLFNDTAYVHYRGRLIPSANWSEGYVFDQTWTGTYDLSLMAPSKMGVSYTTVTTVNSYGNTVTTQAALRDGFTTALIHMHVGDRWQIFMPYQLGYGADAQDKIPAYSTLIFDVTLADFWHAGETHEAWKANTALWED